MLSRFFLVASFLASSALAGGLERRPDGILLPVDQGTLLLQVRDESTIRVAVASDRAFFDRPSLTVQPAASKTPPHWDLAMTGAAVTLKTARLQARVDLHTGAVTFLDPQGRVILAERAGGRSVDATNVDGQKTFHIRQQWEPNPGEALQGLGQHQLGVVDLQGYDLDLWQRNTNVAVPFFVSNRGYGIFWDNPSFTRFGDLRPFAAIPARCLLDDSGATGGLTRALLPVASPTKPQDRVTTADLTYRFDYIEHFVQPTIRYTGSLVAPESGEYQLQTYSNGVIKVWLDGQLVINHWRQKWLTEYDQVKLPLTAGQHYALKIEFGGDDATTLKVAWKTPTPAAQATTSLWSEVADGLDYYFVYGPSLDDVVAGYRRLTGPATMLPRWAFGLWQSRQRYVTAQDSIGVVDEFRRRGIPLDNIVQDWSYWPVNAWGSHEFEHDRFPDPDAWVKALHERHAHVMISVWGKFYRDTANFAELQRDGYLYQPTLDIHLKDWLGYDYTFYDAFNPGARKVYWQQIDRTLFRRGLDAWWLDGSEPDVVQPSPPTLAATEKLIGQTYFGPASRTINAWPLFNSQAVYEGQRSSAPDQRVFILTRSGFAGIHRYATVVWSGDTTSTWTALAKQIAAGLGYSGAGEPYWTMDIGGYTMDMRFAAAHQKPEIQDEWRELNARWFEFGTFAPLTRLHGELQPREPWAFGGEDSPAYQTIVKFDRLRYRLLPYVYSLAGDTSHHGGTMMRPLMMDFPTDAIACASTDEYMFGRALLVAPITQYKARNRNVHLPATAGGWYDFWTGRPVAGSQSIAAAAPYDEIPLFVRAGAIVPVGPDLQYTAEKPADPITLYVYTGADGSFTLYEDDGLTYGYERGEFTEIPVHWNDTTKTLTVGARTGQFTGMLAERTFNVVLVSANSPVGLTAAPTFSKVIRYTGAATDVVLK